MFDFNDYIELAKTLNENKDEASKRSAVSRAYYSSLMYAKKYLTEIGEDIQESGNSHEDIWNTLMNLEGRNKNVANLGFALKRARKAADYSPLIKEGNIHQWSNAALINANAIIKQLADLKKIRDQKRK